MNSKQVGSICKRMRSSLVTREIVNEGVAIDLVIRESVFFCLIGRLDERAQQVAR